MKHWAFGAVAVLGLLAAHTDGGRELLRGTNLQPEGLYEEFEQAQQPQKPVDLNAPHVQQLREMAATHGRVRIIIGFALGPDAARKHRDFAKKPVLTLAGRKARDENRALMAAAQTAFIGRLPPRDDYDLGKISNFPIISLSVDPEGLEAILALPDIENIGDASRMTPVPALDSSGRFISAPQKPPKPPKRVDRNAPHVKALLEKARNLTHVRVLVGFALAPDVAKKRRDRIENPAATLAERKVRGDEVRALMAAAQAAFIDRLPPRDDYKINKLKLSPALSLRVDLAGLEFILAQPDVTGIFDLGSMHAVPFLDSSGPFIGAPELAQKPPQRVDRNARHIQALLAEVQEKGVVQVVIILAMSEDMERLYRKHMRAGPRSREEFNKLHLPLVAASRAVQEAFVNRLPPGFDYHLNLAENSPIPDIFLSVNVAGLNFLLAQPDIKSIRVTRDGGFPVSTTVPAVRGDAAQFH